MPGGRLTQQDRERIASGLAAGLGYAEIARSLARPTSTISREVSRNGGTEGYRADQAHQATERRGRRSRVTKPAPPPNAVDVDGRDPEAVRAFEEQFVALMVQMGLPRMAARVLTCLYTTDSGSLTAAELVGRLRVSPASVSKSVGYLENLRMLRRERDPRRRERYVIDDDVWFRAWEESAKTNGMWADTALLGAEVFDAATPAGARLTTMGRFLAQLSDDMAGGLTETVVDDALTVLAALVHAVAPLTADQLAVALDWPLDRVTAALGAATPDRLTAAQRAALGRA
jgi:hypothetical protein